MAAPEAASRQKRRVKCKPAVGQHIFRRSHLKHSRGDPAVSGVRTASRQRKAAQPRLADSVTASACASACTDATASACATACASAHTRACVTAMAPPRVCFVVAWGASGRVLPSIRETLLGRGSVVDVDSWRGTAPAQLTRNAALLRDAVCKASATERGDIVLVGHSYGCRVVIELLRSLSEDSTGVPPSLCVDRAVLESYPLFPPSPPTAATDRVPPLMQLPARTQLLFSSGEKDPFLHRAWRGGAPSGGAALRDLAAKLHCSTSVLVTAHAAHNSLEGASKAFDAAAAQSDFLREIDELLRA
eukprot:6178401-Pleurochrysis_carterae.AAC.1